VLVLLSALSAASEQKGREKGQEKGQEQRARGAVRVRVCTAAAFLLAAREARLTADASSACHL
jgi:hypothetical protein